MASRLASIYIYIYIYIYTILETYIYHVRDGRSGEDRVLHALREGGAREERERPVLHAAGRVRVKGGVGEERERRLARCRPGQSRRRGGRRERESLLAAGRVEGGAGGAVPVRHVRRGVGGGFLQRRGMVR
jgi:hypothetical protein